MSIFLSYVSTKAHRDSVPAPSTQAEQLSTQRIVNQRSDANYSPARPRRLSTPETDGRGSDVKQSPTKPRRFPRPLSTAGPHFSRIDNGISQHIASTTAQHTPPATKSNAFSCAGSAESSPADVFTSPDNATLAKAYGSILQRPDTLPIHTCARCSSIFPPDATIYPDPQAPHAAGFLCRPCFAAHGGSKGNCADCNREVLTATKEGGFIENSGRVWHKRCFRCNNCHKSIGRAPIVDLYGKPSCSECFNSCLDRKDTPNKKPREPANNMGGMRGRSRESSPALEELSERLGIKRQASSNTPTRETSNSPSPMRASVSCDGESLRLRCSLGGSRSETPLRQPKISGLSGNTNSVPLYPRTSESTTPTELMTPELSSSSSSSESISSAPSTPSNSPRQSLARNSRDSITPKAKGVLPSLEVLSTGAAKCGRCSQSLFSISGDGKIVTVPADMADTPASYHASCFRCCICGDGFDSNDQRHATFVKDSRGVCHPEVCPFVTDMLLSKPRLLYISAKWQTDTLNRHSHVRRSKKQNILIVSQISHQGPHRRYHVHSPALEDPRHAQGVISLCLSWNMVWYPVPRVVVGTLLVLFVAERGRNCLDPDVGRSSIAQLRQIRMVGFGAENAWFVRRSLRISFNLLPLHQAPPAIRDLCISSGVTNTWRTNALIHWHWN